MTMVKSITGILNSMIESVKTVLPFEVSVDQPSVLGQPFEQNEIGVLIGITGDIRGRVMIDADEATIGKIGESMFGMSLEGAMLQSFAGELGNMIAGNLSTMLAKHKIEMDITPPTVLVGNTKVYGFSRAFRLPVTVNGAGNLMIIVMYE